jgi:hypothetical protein
MIESAVQSANQAYVNSQVGIELRLVGVQSSPVAESGSGMSATLGAFKNNSTVRGLRDSLAADMVMLISQDTDWCGYANLNITTTTLNGVTTSNTDAYAVTAARCLSNNTLAHEVGHLQGLDHDRANSTGGGFYEYSFGYRRCVDGGFIDIMSYPCPTSVPRILNFSNPAIAYNGYPTGINWETNPTQAAEAARSLNRSAVQVANYRTAGVVTPPPPPPPAVPPAPTSIAAQNRADGSALVSWATGATNATGFEVRRETWNARKQTWGASTLIASVPVGTLSLVNASGAGTFRYLVRAVNAGGASANAGPATVTVTGGSTPKGRR